MKLFVFVASLLGFSGLTFGQDLPPASDIDCEALPNFSYVPSPTSCADYYQCVNNIAYRLSCPRGYYFSPTELRCMLPHEANCVITLPPTSPPPPTTPGYEIDCEGRENYEYVPSPISCTEYYQCVNDIPYRLACPRGYYFSPTRLRCVSSAENDCFITVPPPPTDPTTPGGPTISCDGVENFRFVPSPISCSNYYQCIDGNPFLLSCPIDLHFNEQLQTCVDPDIAQCDLTPTTPQPPPPRPPPPSCDGVENFWFLRSYAACREYYQCIDGDAILLFCPHGMYFHEAIQACDDPRNVDCRTTIPGTPPSPPPTGPPQDPSCEGLPDFQMIEHPRSCALYFICIGENPFLTSCPVGRYFSETIQACADSDEVDCDIRDRRPTTTTPAPIIDPQCIGVENGQFVANVNSCFS